MIHIGKFKISRVEESILDEDASLLQHFDDSIRDAHTQWLEPDFFNREKNCFYSMIHTWVIEFDDKVIVVDTAGGDDKDRPLSPRFHEKKTGFDERLKAIGVDHDKVDMVLLTHLHVDHVGWNTVLRDGKWVPYFPNAEHVISSTELEFRDPERGAKDKPPASWNTFLDSVKPVVDAGLVREVEGTENLLPGIDLVPIPGHAPGMIGVRVRDAGEEAFLIADVMHQPIQIYHPDWNSKYCENQDLAAETRAKVLAHAADENALLLPAHYVSPYGAYVERSGNGYRHRFPELKA